MDKQGLSPERQRRLEELRARYPKQEPQPPEPEYHNAYLIISLHFEFQAMSQEEADRAAFDWMWHKAHDLANMLHRQYAKDGLRDISLIQECRGYTQEPAEELTPTDDLYLLDLEDVRESDLQN